VSYFSELSTFSRFLIGLPAFLRRRLTREEAHAAIRERIARR
jgi:hypothetical protein